MRNLKVFRVIMLVAALAALMLSLPAPTVEGIECGAYCRDCKKVQGVWHCYIAFYDARCACIEIPGGCEMFGICKYH